MAGCCFVVAMRMRIFFVIAMSFLGAVAYMPPALAQSARQILVEGNKRVEAETVRSYMQMGTGGAGAIDNGIKALYQTGLFSDVRVTQRGSALVVHVEENPLINRVNFEGNKGLKDRDLAKETELKESSVFSRAKVQNDINRLTALYQRGGYNSVVINPKLIRLPENRVNLVFEIREGREVRIKKIVFIGNRSFRSTTLQSQLATSEHNWWKFFSKTDNYDPDRLDYDKELLRRFYMKNGFADVKINSAEAKLVPDRSGYMVVYNIEEGPRYTLSDVVVDMGAHNFNQSKLRAVMKTGPGDRYDANKVELTADQLAFEAAKQGYIFAKVDQDIKHTGPARLRLNYSITEGPRVYVERIDIVGNTRTLDKVIRRELQIYEGDALNRALLDRARRRLVGLDFFAKIDFREDMGSSPDKVILVVSVEEKSTGKINFSAGYSTSDGVIGTIGISESNFMGKGQNIALNTSLSQNKQEVDFSFTEPYFLGLPLYAGFDAFGSKSNKQKYSSYKSKEIGGAVRTGFEIDEYSSLGFKYLLSYRKVSGIEADAAPAIRAQEGRKWKSAISATYTWDNLDNPINPSSGFRGRVEAEYAGLGGTVRYGRLEGSAWYFYPIYEDQVVLKLQGHAGIIKAFGGRSVPLDDRFFKGYDSFRGFDVSGIGPRQTNNSGDKDAIGGMKYAIGTVELTFPVGLPEEWGIQGAAFSDFGTVYGTQDKSVAKGVGGCTYAAGCTVYDGAKFRASVGAGIIWQSPFGSLRIDASVPLKKASYDKKEWFRFSYGTRF